MTDEEREGYSPLQFLLRELREQRVAAGLTQGDLAKKINYSDSHVSGVETGVRAVRSAYLKVVDDALGLRGLLLRLWEDFVRYGASPAWLRRWIEVECEATALRSFEGAVIPGLLQTEHYAQALLNSGLMAEDSVRQRVTARIARQAILTGEKAPQFLTVIDETVLRRPIGGPGIMRHQLEALIKWCEFGHVQVHVVPISTGAYPGLGGPFVLATLRDDNEVAYLDNQVQGVVTDRREHLTWLRQAWESILADALPQQQSIDLIEEVAKTWT
jgi:transcriptional regulator with XRE-family HTH domain